MNKKMNITNEERLIAGFLISNFKSYFGDPILFKITKPITIIAGPNGEGKTNLLEAMLVVLANFVNHSPKIKKEALFTTDVKISTKPEISTTFYELIFSNLIKKALSGLPRKIYFSERLNPQNIMPFKKKSGNIAMRILKLSDEGKKKNLAEATLPITRSPFKLKKYSRKLDHLEVLYLDSDVALTDLFVKAVGQEFSNQFNKIQGVGEKNRFLEGILSLFPNNRLISDIEKGEFKEIYLNKANLFLMSNLATGAKKECILYLLGILAEKHKKKKDWLAIFLIDGIEDGLHVSRQRNFAEALIKAFNKNEELKKHIKIVITTHSPVIYSELMRYPEHVDVYFVFRNHNESSKIFPWDGKIGDKFLEKRILTELGLSIYELPERIVFVEGKTDRIFWSKILEYNARVFHLTGASIPNILQDLMSSFPLARSKRYWIVVDQSGRKKIEKDVKAIKSKVNININVLDTDFNSLEELIFDVNLGSEEPSDAWNKIEKRVEELREKVEESEKAIIEINVKAAREKLEKKGKDGLRYFFESLKNKDNFYKVIGKNWSQLLKEKGKEKIKEIKDTIKK